MQHMLVTCPLRTNATQMESVCDKFFTKIKLLYINTAVAQEIFAVGKCA
jgi:hypothetical protein